VRGLLRSLAAATAGGAGAPGDEGYRCAGCGARWSYEAVRYVALCPECASGLVRITEPDARTSSVHGRGAPPAAPAP
jgi:DNA-directed RNA polymerase subunit RPC12/RpoP